MNNIAHYLKPITKSEIPERFIFFDSESRVDTSISEKEIENVLNDIEVEKYHDLYLICADFLRTSKTRNTERSEVYTGLDMKDNFWNDVIDFTPSKTKTWVFAHNVKYDLLVTGGIPVLASRGFKIQAFSDTDPFFFIFKNEELKQSIMILSSTNYYKFSLKELGKYFNLDKGSIEYDTEDIKKAIEYCKQDVLILKTAVLEYINFIKENDLGSLGITLPSQAFTAYRRKFMKPDLIFLHRHIEVIKLERSAYAGGRNEALKLGKLQAPIFGVDVNSMYPAVMKDQKYPVKMVSFRVNQKISEVRKYINNGYGVIAECEVSTDKPVFFKKDTRLLFPVGSFTTSLSTPEMIYGLNHGLIKNINKIAFYEMANIFTDYVNFFYDNRIKAKEENNNILDLMFKLFMTSLYGKFGQRNIKWEKIGDADDPLKIISFQAYNADTNQLESFKIFGGSEFIKKKLPEGEAEAYNSFPAIASHVTAQARMMLWNYMEISGIENIFYMDTDSLFLNETGYINLLENNCISDYELGKLKLEKVGEKVIIKGCKDYIFDDIEKIKGINLKSLETGSTIKLDEGKYISTIWTGFSKAFKNENMSGYKNILQVKKLSREYIKGEVLENGDVRPFTYNENENITPIIDLEKIARQEKQYQKQIERMKIKDPILEHIKQSKGLNCLKNGTYKEELSRIHYPYRNFTNGIKIDILTEEINSTYNQNFTVNELIEYIENHI